MTRPTTLDLTPPASAIEPLLTTAEAAAALNVKLSTLQWKIARGEWPVVRLSPRVIRLRASDVRRIAAGEFAGVKTKEQLR